MFNSLLSPIVWKFVLNTLPMHATRAVNLKSRLFVLWQLLNTAARGYSWGNSVCYVSDETCNYEIAIFTTEKDTNNF
jgi:hypothetical protein